ncbi:hypothetical protein TNIN_469121 [Trichonephila inaurata madagascariensis]|uniref:Uncharacterized protein n=1 Tax=Trichonephila inaurata madagascariensis TaxID=2747483 RepID=A0A8X7BUN7_9ARAC|nr:hypothetical protein TNIN_469121 [Trichonephila inaurata madagascariensis]
MGYKRKVPASRSAGPERKKSRRQIRDQQESFDIILHIHQAKIISWDVIREFSSRPSGRAVQAHGEPVRSRRKPFSRPSPYSFNQHRQSRQQGRQQPKQSLRSRRSSPILSKQSRQSKQQGRQQSEKSLMSRWSSLNLSKQSQHSRQQGRQEPKDSPKSRRSTLLEVHIEDVKERR